MRHPRSGSFGLKAILTLFALSSLVLVSGCAKKSSEATAGRRYITSYLPAQGTVVAPASARADVYSPYTAPVEKIYVTVGQNVRRGETLIDFSPPQTQAYYDQARTALVQAQQSLAQARKHFGQDVRTAQKQLAASRSTERKARVAGPNTPSPTGDADQPVSAPADTGVHKRPGRRTSRQ